MKYFCWENLGGGWTPSYYLTHPRETDMKIHKVKRSKVILIPETLDEMIQLYPGPEE